MVTMQHFFDSIHLQGILSFAPDSEPIPLGPLNVLIGPNGSGKSNLLEVISLLRAIPVDLAEAAGVNSARRIFAQEFETRGLNVAGGKNRLGQA